MFTIGYATKPIEDYISQLKYYGVTVVADARSVPFSKRFFDYHQDALRRHLHHAGIRYVYLGDELGPRSKDPGHYDDRSQVQFDRLMDSDLFQSGIKRLFDGQQKGFSIALTCACRDPAICHRALLIGWALLHKHQLDLQHILHEGTLETQSELERRLLQMTATVPDIFTGEAGALSLAYQRQCQACAYRKPVNAQP
jgi:uncharacterized protein (DUF488 family)